MRRIHRRVKAFSEAWNLAARFSVCWIGPIRGGDMSRTANCILLGIVCIASAVAWTQASGSNASANSFTVIFKDGHQKTYADVNRIDFKGPGAMVLTHGGREERLSLADVSRIDFSPSAAFP